MQADDGSSEGKRSRWSGLTSSRFGVAGGACLPGLLSSGPASDSAESRSRGTDPLTDTILAGRDARHYLQSNYADATAADTAGFFRRYNAARMSCSRSRNSSRLTI